MVPLLSAVLISFIISGGLSMSIYDVMLDIKELPYLPALKTQELYDKEAKDIMQTNHSYLKLESTLRDLAIILENKTNLIKIPVIDEESNLHG
jgi:chloride channel 2